MAPQRWHTFALVVLLVFSLAAAGCSSKSKSSGSTDSTTTQVPPTAPPAGRDDETCAIQGFAMDDEANPVADAAIAVLGTTPLLTTRSAEDGSFSFSFVTPGTYTLTGSKAGYEATLISVQCLPGTTAVPELRMIKIPPPAVPFVVPYQPEAGYIGCGVGFPLQGGLLTNDYCRQLGVDSNELDNKVSLPVEPGNITGVVYELTWTPSWGAGGDFLRLFYPAEMDSDEVVFTVNGHTHSVLGHYVVGSNPIRIQIEAANQTARVYERGEDGVLGDFTVTPATKDPAQTLAEPSTEGTSRVVYQQRFDLYVTLFYNHAPIPPNYTMLEA